MVFANFFCEIIFCEISQTQKVFSRNFASFLYFFAKFIFSKNIEFRKKSSQIANENFSIVPFFRKSFRSLETFHRTEHFLFYIKVLTTVLHVLHVNFPWNSKSSRKLYNDFLNKKYLRGRMQLDGGV